MKLQDILDYFDNPMGKVYEATTGVVAFQYGQDAGEARYAFVRWNTTARRWWIPVYNATSMLPVGDWKPLVGKTEEDLIALADKAWEDSEPMNV